MQKNVDVFSMSGKHTATNLYYPIVLKSGKVFYEGKECADALDGETGMLKFNFKHLGVDNPMINALILYKGTLDDTDYNKLDDIKRKYDAVYREEKVKRDFEDKYLSQISTAKLKQKRRNDQLINLEDYEQIYIEEELTGSSNLYVIGALVAFVSFGVFFVMSVKQSIMDADAMKKK